LRTLRCGVIGCGRIGCGFDDKSKEKTVITHAGSYFTNPKTRLVSLCDVDKLKLKKYGKKYHVDALHTKSSTMFKKENLDCVSICTTVNSHLELVKEAVKYAVKGIFLEKPISNDLKSAKKIIEICKKNKVILIINHQRRFDPYYHSLKKFLQNKKLGNIQFVDIYYGGGIANTGSHLFDLLRFFFGDINKIQGTLSNIRSPNKLDPNLELDINFKSGFNGHVHPLDFNKFVIFEMSIFGTLGRLNVNLVANKYDFEYYKTINNHSLGFTTLIKSSLSIKKPKKSAIYYGVENLVNCVNMKSNPLCTGEDGYKSLELIAASMQSIKTSKRIQLPIRNNNYKISSK